MAQRPYCEEHPGSPAIARCNGCGKYLCRECVREAASRAYCARCAESAGGTHADGEGRAQTSAAPAPPLPPHRAAPLREPASSVPPPPQSASPAGPSGAAAAGAYRPPPPAGAPPAGAPAPAAGGPVGARLAATCAFHPGMRAVTRCSKCGALICAGCQRDAGGKRFCDHCYQQAHAAARRTPLRAPGGPSLAQASWRLWPGLAFLPLPFALSGIMSYMMRQGDKVSVGAAQLLLSLLLYASMLFFAFSTVSRYGPALGELGFNASNLLSSLGTGIVGGSFAFWAAIASAYLSYGIFERLGDVERWLQGFYDVNVKNTTGVDLLIAGAIIVVVAPVCEEIFFRGYLYPAMRNRMGVWGAAALNGFLFSAVHFSVFGLIGRTLAGALFCLLYEYNDNLWSPITAHALNNFVAFFLPLVYLSGRL